LVIAVRQGQVFRNRQVVEQPAFVGKDRRDGLYR
jgi:hypothetical protein